MNTFDCLIPVPQRVEFSDKDFLTIAEIKNFYIDNFFVDFIGEIDFAPFVDVGRGIAANFFPFCKDTFVGVVYI